MAYYTEGSLHDTVLFKTINSGSKLLTIVNEYMKTGVVITPQHIEEQLIQIQKTRISPLADKVVSAFQKGEIIIVYSKTVKIPQPLPFMVLKLQGTMKSVVFINNHGSLVENTKAGSMMYLNTPMKDLYTIMEGAYVALQYGIYPISITKNLGLMKLSNAVYTQMFMRILNKEYAINMDKEIYDRVSFVVSRFFLDNVWEGTNRDVNTTYAINNILNPNKSDLIIISEMYNEAAITNIEELIAFLKTVTKRLEKLNMRYFTQCWLNTYKSPALFSMECLPYFLFTTQASLIGSFIVNQPILSDMYKNIKGMNTFYAELTKSV